MIPQVQTARADVGGLHHPVVAQFMLEVEVPLHDVRDNALGAVGANRAKRGGRVGEAHRGGQDLVNVLARGRDLTGAEVLGVHREIGRVQSQVIENVAFLGVKDSKGAAYHRALAPEG